jgi:hypothetical protein
MDTSLAKFRDIVLQLLSSSYISYFCLFFLFQQYTICSSNHYKLTSRKYAPFLDYLLFSMVLNTFPRQKILNMVKIVKFGMESYFSISCLR